MPSILKSNRIVNIFQFFLKTSGGQSRLLILMTGLLASVGQVVFIRESFAIFSGNELVLGILLSIWLLSGAGGSFTGWRIRKWNTTFFIVLYVFSFILGLILLRSIRLFLAPGSTVPPYTIIIILLMTITPAAFLSGYAFGVQCYVSKSIYRYENAGAAAGLVLLSILIHLQMPNSLMIFIGLMLLITFIKVKRNFLFLMIGIASIFLITDKISSRWKYSVQVKHLICGHEGEIAIVENEGNKLLLLNNLLYRINTPLPQIEQAVNVPISSCVNPHNALLIFNAGHLDLMKKYHGLDITCIESEPVLADKSCLIRSPEKFNPAIRFDVIIMGSGFPESLASSRFYSSSFFEHMHSLVSDSGIFSFTLPFNTSYLSKNERILKDVITITLADKFRFVKIFPGDGYTFLASDNPITLPRSCSVATGYFGSFILPAVTDEQVNAANESSTNVIKSTTNHPVVLALGLQRYLDQYKISLRKVSLMLLGGFIIILFFLIRRFALLSVVTSGFTTGVYSISLMLIYQFCYGLLYSNLSILLVALSIGFTIGGFLKKFPYSDWVIAVYTIISVPILVYLNYPPFWLFLILNFGIGFLVGAQFVCIEEKRIGILYAADLVGGVMGMVLGSIYLIPSFGILKVVVCMTGFKLIAAINTTKRSFRN